MQSKVRYQYDMVGSSALNFDLEPVASVLALDYAKSKVLMEAANVVETTYRLQACDKEPWTVAFIESLPKGSWFIDIGASTGPYTLVALANGLNVVAIEPSFENYRRLCRNLALNQWLDKAVVLCCAIGKESKLSWLNYFDIRPGAGGNRMGDLGKQTWHRQLIPTVPLDVLLPWFGTDAPLHIKIDVDGDEESVLAGAKTFFANPLVKGAMIEIPTTPPDLVQSLVDLMHKAGLEFVAKYDMRADAPIGGVCYMEFRR